MTGESSKRKSVFLETGSSKKKKKSSSKYYIPKNWDFLIPEDNWFKGKITLHSPHEVICCLNEKFTEHQKNIFKESCFGAFIELKEIVLQPQLIHQMLLRQVKQPNPNKMWFNVNDQLVRFSVVDFCLMSGLRCVGNGDFTKYRPRDSYLKGKYFKDYENVTTQDVEEVFKNLPVDTEDKDLVDIGVIYLITTFLFGTSYHKGVEDSIFGLVESDDMNSFPWGKELYSNTLSSLKNAFNQRMKNIFTEKNFLEYRLSGFILPFQVWVYETIPLLAKKKCCSKYKSQRPRMLSWSSKEHLTSVSLRKRIFDLLQLEVNSVVPLEVEKEEGYTFGLFVEDEDDDFELPVGRPKKLLDVAQLSSYGRISKSVRKMDKGKSYERVQQSNEGILKRLSEIEMKLQSNDMILSRISELESKLDIKVQSNTELEDRLKVVEDRMKMNKDIIGRLNILERKVYAQSTELKSTPNEMIENTDKILDEYPSFSLGVEFEASGGKKNSDLLGKNVVQIEVGKSEEGSEKSDKLVKKFDEEVELMDDIWQKAIEISDAIAIENEMQQENVEVIEIDDEKTPDVPLKRKKKPAAYLNSPWVNEFESASTTKKRVVKGTFEFPVGLDPPNDHDVDAFETWFKEGFRPKNKHKHFDDAYFVIKPCFYFTDIRITNKQWWYELYTPKECLDDSMIRHGLGINFKATTTDFAFDSQIRGLYCEFSKDKSVIANQSCLLSYVIGLYMPCNTSWCNVDHILMPVRMSNSAHWILFHFDIQKMCLNVYNSYKKVMRKAIVIEAV